MAAKEALRLAPSRLDDSDVEVDDHLLSSSDEESEDETKQSKIRQVIESLDKTTSKRKKHQRFEPSANISEFNLSSSADQDKVDLNDLIGSLQKDGGYGSLKKRLESLEKNAGTLDVPLHKPEAEKIQRTIAYEETSKEIGKWQPIVKKNREAEHLSFPVNPYKPPEITIKSLAANFKPRTPLEEEIAAVLRGSSHMMERNNKELTQQEEQALLTMSVEEAKERRKELQRLRALQSYYEEKCRRAKKIKSKKYHRIKKRGEKRAASKQTLEDLEKTDPEKAMEELEKLDRERAKERLSLKHRSTSKWAKYLLIRGQNNPEAKRALQDQLELSRQLTEKQKNMEEEEEEGEESQETEAEDETNTFGSLVASEDNPWAIDKSGDKTNSIAGNGGTEELAAFKRIQPVYNKDSSDMEGIHDENSDTEQAEDDFEITVVKSKKLAKSKTKKKKKIRVNQSEEKMKTKSKKKNDPETCQTDNTDNKKKSKKRKIKETIENALDFDLETGSHGNIFDEEPTITKDTLPAVLPKSLTSLKSTSVIVDPKKIFPHENQDTNLHGDDADQLLTIQQAFANDDVIEDFVREKEEAVESSKGKDIDLTLPGWGEWGGPGVKVSKQKKNKFVKKAEETGPRQDKHLPHVILNEEVNKKFVKMQVMNVPHPYMNASQFEKSIRNPVGKQWNTATAVKQLTKPRVHTQMGTIIEPIKPTKELKRASKDPGNNNKKKKRSKNKGDESLAIYD